MKISDLITLSPVRTVIRLADLSDKSLRRHLVQTFIFTGEVSFAVKNIMDSVADLKGKGFFVIGNFGSGKSHLLNVLSLIFTDPEARAAFIESCRDGGSSGNALADPIEAAARVNPLVVEISLVEHSNREYLEEIVLKEVSARLPSDMKGQAGPLQQLGAMPRREAFETIAGVLRDRGHGGLLLLFDELSEFLRSKDNPRAYNEDIRFLQYLGEFAETVPAWIVATMQENIENTGSLAGEMLHKIKDRYPVRFRLSGEHVKEIVSGRLVCQNETAAERLPRVYDQLQGIFNRLPFSREDFLALYPVHPSTVAMLDELRLLFSQHRGVIDFIHYRLAGDPGRGIEPFIDNSDLELLTPDYIFDHFRDRLQETVETNPYSEQVFHHYEREAEKIFSDPEDAQTALRLLKILILGAVARDPQSYSVNELTALLLYPYSILESAVNYEYISGIMGKLMAHGAYLTVAEKEGEPYYSIDLKADIGLLLDKKLSQIKAELPPGDRRVLEGLFGMVDENWLSLKSLHEQPELDVEVTWQNTRRAGKVMFKSLAGLSRDSLALLERELAEGKIEFIFLVAPPELAGEQGQLSETWQAFFEQCSDELRRVMVLWLPRSVNPSEEELMRSAYAHLKLYREYASDNSPVGKQAERQLALLLSEEKATVKNLFRKIYFEGRIKAGGHMPAPVSFGYLPFMELTSRVVAESLKERYPRHSEIRPLSEQVSGALVQQALDYLFSTEQETAGEPDRGIKVAIEGFLNPMGLVRKKGQGFVPEINPKTSPLVAEFLSGIPDGGRIALEQLYSRLGKGAFGLSRPAFLILAMTLILSGAVSAYQGGKRLALPQVNYYRFWNIEEIGPGSLIRPELQQVLAEVSFLPARLRSGPLTFAVQQQAWEKVIEFKMDWANRLARINRQIERFVNHPFFKNTNWESIHRTVDRFNQFLNEIKTSYASREGLERFLAACGAAPLYAEDLRHLSALSDFFDQDIADVLHIFDYLNDEKLILPPDEKYDLLRQRHRVISELLKSDSILFEEKHRERLKREFEAFRVEYAELYLSGHEQQVGPQRIEAYRALTGSSAYRLLEQLGRINTLVLQKDLVYLNRLIAPVLGLECAAADESRLVKYAACSCGYQLGEQFVLPERRELEKEIGEAVRSYLKALQAAAVGQKLIEHADQLELVGRRLEAAPLRKLLQLDSGMPADQLVQELGKIVNGAVVKTVNRVLTGDAIIAERSIKNLQHLLSGRVFSLNQLQQLFDNWLCGDEAEKPAYVRVTSEESSGYQPEGGSGNDLAREAEPQFKGLLESEAPALLPFAAKMKAEELIGLALLCAWFKHHNLGKEGAVLVNKVLDVKGAYSDRDSDWLPDLTRLGEAVIDERDKYDLPGAFRDAAAEQAMAMITAEELIELYLQSGASSAYNFEALLNLFLDEPIFPEVSRKAAHRLAGQISAGEAVSQLNLISGLLREALIIFDREAEGLNADHRKDKEKALGILQKIAGCSLIIQEADNYIARPPDSDKKWERFYRLISPFELSMGHLEEAGARALFPGVTAKNWRKRYKLMLAPMVEAFAEYLKNEEAVRRQSLSGLLKKLAEWAGKENYSAGVYLVIVDGARLDLWSALLEQALDSFNYEVLREGLTWAEQPTVTDTQLQPLKDEGLLGHLLNMDENLLAELIADPTGFLEAVRNMAQPGGKLLPFKAIKFGFVDDKIHSSRDPLPVLLEELLAAARKQLHPLLKYAPAGSVLLLTADHGFKTNLNFDKSDKNALLYLHGGDTLFETLSPWVLVRKSI